MGKRADSGRNRHLTEGAWERTRAHLRKLIGKTLRKEGQLGKETTVTRGLGKINSTKRILVGSERMTTDEDTQV